MSGPDFVLSINACFSEIVHWKRNLFKIPSGKAGKAFVKELSSLFWSYGESSALEPIALTAAFVLPALMLQKPSSRSKAKEHSVCLAKRLELWKQGDIDSLMVEGRTIQNHISSSHPKSFTANNEARTFANLVKEGKLKAAQRLLSNDDNGKPMALTEEVKHCLEKKHPARHPPSPEAVIPEQENEFRSQAIIFDQIDGKLILDCALKSDGAAGPSGLDASAWKRLCSSFGSHSVDLCNAIASVSKRICTTYVNPEDIRALVACRLIALDKCPGVRPIGIGETVRRIMARAILSVLKDDIKKAAGPIQLCAGQESGCEAAIHALNQIFEDPNTDAVLLVDASNAFNSLNRETALRNIQALCPALSTVLINTYREDIPLFIGGKTLLSQEGTTQGDPLAMAMYALAVTPLIKDLNLENTKQVWFADDASAGASLTNLRSWWDTLLRKGPAYGYYPNPEKSWIVTKENKHNEAIETFEGTCLNITTEGRRYLGSAIGQDTFVERFVESKVSMWVDEIKSLAKIAKTQPHAVYALYTHCTMHRWTFLSRTTPGIAHLLKPLEDAICNHLIPSLTGHGTLTQLEREIVALLARLGGLGIPNPSLQAPIAFQNSRTVSSPLTSLIHQQRDHLPEYTFKFRLIQSKK